MTVLLGLVLEILTLVSNAELQHKASSSRANAAQGQGHFNNIVEGHGAQGHFNDAGPEGHANNKFLITDGLLRGKPGFQKPLLPESPSAAGLHPNKTLQHGTSTPSPRHEPELTTKWLTKASVMGSLPVTKMHLMQRDGAYYDKSPPGGEDNVTRDYEPVLLVNKEAQLVGQHMECDPMHESRCHGSQCVQHFEGLTKCVDDPCRLHFLLPCRNGKECYSQAERCDGRLHCGDSSDEQHCLTLVQVHDERHFYTRTVPFMAILCLMGVAASFVLYHQTNTARRRQRHLSMVGLTNALTTAGLTQHIESRDYWRPRGPGGERPGPGLLLGDVPDSDTLDHTTTRLERIVTGMHDYSSMAAQQHLQLLATPDGYCDDHLDANSSTAATTFHDSYRPSYSTELSEHPDYSSSAPPSYETALEMGIMSNGHRSNRGVATTTTTTVTGVTIDCGDDPPPYESVSHITCTSVFSMTKV